MGINVTATTYADVTRRVRHNMTKAVAAANPFYPQLCTRVPSENESEDYDWLGQLPGMREWLGDRKFKELSSYDFNIKNKDWEQSIALPKKKIDDNKSGYFDSIAVQMANEASYHPDELLASLISAAESTVCFDGQFFFDTDHSMGDSGTQSNLLTYSAAAVARINSHTAPDADSFRYVVEKALDAFWGFKGDNGKALHRPTIQPISDLMVVVPPKWYSAAVEAYASRLKVDSSGVASVDNWNIVAPRVVAIQGMPDAIDVYRTGQEVKPYVFQDRERLKFQTKGENDIEYKDIKFMASARYNMGVFAWWMGIRSKLTA